MNIERVEDLERKLSILKRQRDEFEERGQPESVAMLDSMIKLVRENIANRGGEARVPSIGVPAAE